MKKQTEKDKIEEYKGHRLRLKEKFDEQGEQSLADYELLELILFQSISRKDTKPISKALLKKFDTLGAIFGAPRQQLVEVKGMGENTARDIKAIHAMISRSIRSKIVKRNVFDNWKDLIAYCNSTMAHLKIEQFRILFLDKKDRLITEEVQQVGTVDHTPVYTREVIKRTLELDACGIILVHNHPSGDPRPSRADLEMTSEIIESAKNMEIKVHDHLIISKTGHISLKKEQLVVF